MEDGAREGEAAGEWIAMSMEERRGGDGRSAFCLEELDALETADGRRSDGDDDERAGAGGARDGDEKALAMGVLDVVEGAV